MTYKAIEIYTNKDCGEYIVEQKGRGYSVAFWDAYSALLYNRELLTIQTYCEHDITINGYTDIEHFEIELAMSLNWYNTEYAA